MVEVSGVLREEQRAMTPNSTIVAKRIQRKRSFFVCLENKIDEGKDLYVCLKAKWRKLFGFKKLISGKEF